MSNDTFIVYMATNTVNGKRYIGITKQGLAKRKYQHLNNALRTVKGGCRVFAAAIRKYGPEVFNWEEILSVDSYDFLLKEEIRLIAELSPEYNITKGGQGMNGLVLSQEHRDRIAASLRGKKHPPERVAKLRGQKRSDEVKEKFRQNGLKFSRIMEFRHLGPEASSKKVVRLNDGKIFESASAAAADAGVSKSLVIEVCNRTPKRKTAGGYVFRYYGDHQIGFDEESALAKKISSKRKNNGRSKKKILCINDGEIFDGLSSAAKQYNIDIYQIATVCRGDRNHTHGLRFEYIE